MPKRTKARRKTRATQSKIKCFVPSCNNRKFANEKVELQFFRVPDGIEGVFWTRAVKFKQRKYEKMIDLLSSTDNMLGSEDSANKSRKFPQEEVEYCCEVHFDIDVDIEKFVGENGLVEYKVKPGAVPSAKRKQDKRLCDIDQENCEDAIEMYNGIDTELIKSEESITGGIVIESNNVQESTNEAPTNGYLSIVDISTITNQMSNVDFPYRAYYEVTNLDEQQTENSDEHIMPMLPLTAALMKRKSPYYMGLLQNHFLSLLKLASQRTQLSEAKVMITLRKLHLNEEFELLGDLFDIDKTTAERYFQESKHIVTNLVDILDTAASPSIEVTSKPIVKIEQCVTSDVPDPILVEPIAYRNNYEDVNEVDVYEQSEVESSSATYVTSEEDPDILSEDLDSPSDDSCTERTDECPLCNKFFTPVGLEMHIRKTHSMDDINRTTCGLCLQKFDTKSLLKAHQKDIHGGGAYGCDVCGKIVVSKKSIELHILTKHAQVKTFLCDTCGEGFPYSVNLHRHVKDKHIRTYKCNLCDMKYFNRSALQDHIRGVHTKERPFQCAAKDCGKTFSNDSTFRSHKRVHAEDKHECNICSKQFSFKGNLQTHLKNIHGQMGMK